MLPVVLVAFALTTIPQAFVLDLLFSHAPVMRAISAVLHGYAIVWLLAIAHAVQTQMHEVDATTVTLRFPLLRFVVFSQRSRSRRCVWSTNGRAASRDSAWGAEA